jgi:hypothetical protein
LPLRACSLPDPVTARPGATSAASCEKIRSSWNLSHCFVSRLVFDENPLGIADKVQEASRFLEAGVNND